MDNNQLGTIYSKNFKRWFGDWENDPQNASKVVDSNGMPLPVYHGTVRKGKDGLPFKVFRTESDAGEGVMFSDNYSVASFFSGHGEARFGNFEEKYEKWPYKDTMDGLVNFLNNVLKNGKYKVRNFNGVYNGEPYDFFRLECDYYGGASGSSPLGDTKEEALESLRKEVEKEIRYMERDSKYNYTGGVYNVYLNIRKPYVFDAQGSQFHMLKTEFHQKRMTVFDLVYFVKQTGKYDGVIVKNVRETTYGNGIMSTDYIVFNANQIKHALDNNGNFGDVDDMTEGLIRRAVNEAVTKVLSEVRYIDTRDEKYNGKVHKNHWTDIYNQESITNDSRIRVFHGCELKTACDIAINGTSGKTYHARQYSYEAGMNPLGIFVTTDFETAKKFGVSNSGMAIIEFTAKGSDLESPIWNGQGSYFGQGSNPMPFKDKDERNAQKMQYRQNALNTQDDYYYDDKHRRRDISMSHVRNSDKPEMADRIFNNAEHQALFMGDLNPNMIKRIWVKLPREDGYVHTSDNYQPMSVREFLKQFKNKEWCDGTDLKGNWKYSKIKKERLFDPAENVASFDDLVDRLYQKEKQFFNDRNDAEQALKDLGMLQTPPSDAAYDTIKYELWPRQIIQLYGKDYFDSHFNRLGQ